MAITVVVADGEPIFRSGLRCELARWPSIEVVAEASSGDEAMRLVRRLKPDVLLLGVRLAEGSAYSVAATLHEDGVTTRVIAMGGRGRDSILAMLAAGVAGYVLRDESPRHMARAVEVVSGGRPWYSDTVLDAVLRPDAAASAPGAALSPRERQVLAMLAAGTDNEGIARSMGISDNTVRYHMRSLHRKLGLRSRAELVAWAARLAEGPERDEQQ